MPSPSLPSPALPPAGGFPAPPAICLMSGDLAVEQAQPASLSAGRPRSQRSWQGSHGNRVPSPRAREAGAGGRGREGFLAPQRRALHTGAPTTPRHCSETDSPPRRGPQHPDTRLPRVGTLPGARARGTRLGHTDLATRPGCRLLGSECLCPRASPAPGLSRELWPHCREGTVGVRSHGTRSIHSRKKHLRSHGGGSPWPHRPPARGAARSPAVPEGWWKDAALTAHLAVKASEPRVSTWPAWGGAGHTRSH